MQFRHERSHVEVASEERAELCILTALHRTHCILRDTEVPTRTRPGSAPFLPCVSLSFWYLCVVFCSDVLHPGEGLEIVTSLDTLQGAALFVVGAWTRHDRDPESDSNAGMFMSRNRDLECGW